MKLYTEEQVIKLINWEVPTVVSLEELREIVNFDLIPIELPSDEEIGKDIGSGMHDYYKGGFIEGAKWMKEQILNQNK
jgi:hypothetical protein